MRRRLEAGQTEGNDGEGHTLPPAVIVRGLDQAEAALRAAGSAPLLLLSPPEAARLLGPAWWVAMLSAARASVPGAAARGVLDCGGSAGTAQEALASGVDGILFTGGVAAARRLASISALAGALFLTARPAALDLGSHGAERKLPLWLGVPRDRTGGFV
jgi:acyl-CoA reductase-like NAD-dependent aldehyde dehydrogenase